MNWPLSSKLTFFIDGLFIPCFLCLEFLVMYSSNDRSSSPSDWLGASSSDEYSSSFGSSSESETSIVRTLVFFVVFDGFDDFGWLFDIGWCIGVGIGCGFGFIGW